jgi:hypothetical protein
MDSNKLDSKDRTRYWTAHIEKRRMEKLSKRAYCKREGIGYASFLRWEGRLMEKSATCFVEIQPAKPDHGAELVILAGNGIRIKVDEDFNEERLIRTIRALVGPA